MSGDGLSREERAFDVRATYDIEQAGPQCWLVRHPVEDDRFYLVDMAQQTCECPDFQCRKDEGIVCKHILAILPEWEKLTGKRLPFVHRGKLTADAGFIAIQDVGAGEDPFVTD